MNNMTSGTNSVAQDPKPPASEGGDCPNVPAQHHNKPRNAVELLRLGHGSDCLLEFGNLLRPVHTWLLAPWCPRFEKLPSRRTNATETVVTLVEVGERFPMFNAKDWSGFVDAYLDWLYGKQSALDSSDAKVRLVQHADPLEPYHVRLQKTRRFRLARSMLNHRLGLPKYPNLDELEFPQHSNSVALSVNNDSNHKKLCREDSCKACSALQYAVVLEWETWPFREQVVGQVADGDSLDMTQAITQACKSLFVETVVFPSVKLKFSLNPGTKEGQLEWVMGDDFCCVTPLFLGTHQFGFHVTRMMLRVALGYKV